MGKPHSQKSHFELRVYLRGMRSEDALQTLLPPEYTGLCISELLESVFPDDEEGQSYVEDTFDLRENPDLLDIYDTLLDVFEDWRMGRCALTFSEVHGSKVELSDPVVEHFGMRRPAEQEEPGYPILDLVMEQEFPALDHAVEKGYWEDKEKLLEWLQSLTLLYFLDKHEFQLSDTPTTEIDQQLLPIAEVLEGRQIIVPTEETGHFDITEPGRQFIGNLIAETESYIDRFDVFKDVAYDIDAGTVEFDTGYGEDLRVQVFIDEGLDPVRVVFLLSLYDGTLDEFISSWRQLIHDVKFYDEILEPVMNHHQIHEELISWIIEGGYAYIEEREEEERENFSHREILERVRGKRSLPIGDDTTARIIERGPATDRATQPAAHISESSNGKKQDE